jgi:hypothetical protein
MLPDEFDRTVPRGHLSTEVGDFRVDWDCPGHIWRYHAAFGAVKVQARTGLSAVVPVRCRCSSCAKNRPPSRDEGESSALICGIEEHPGGTRRFLLTCCKQCSSATQPRRATISRRNCWRCGIMLRHTSALSAVNSFTNSPTQFMWLCSAGNWRKRSPAREIQRTTRRGSGDNWASYRPCSS